MLRHPVAAEESHLEDSRVKAAPEGVFPVWPELDKVTEALPSLRTDLHSAA